MESIRESERLAKIALESVIPGSVLKYREDQAHGQYDFDLLQNNEIVGGVEVTESANSELTRTIEGIRKRGAVITGVLCKKRWLVFLGTGADDREVRRKIDANLAELESHGIERFGLSDRDHLISQLRDELGITGAYVIDGKGPSSIVLQYPHAGSAHNPGTAAKAAEAEARKEDNRRKLRTCIGSRHLAVYVSRRNLSAWIALTEESLEPPPQHPTLPTELTDLWIFGDVNDRRGFVIWHASENQPWERRIPQDCNPEPQ